MPSTRSNPGNVQPGAPNLEAGPGCATHRRAVGRAAWAMTVGIPVVHRGCRLLVVGALLAVEPSRPAARFGKTRRAERTRVRCEMFADATSARPATIGMTASAPATSVAQAVDRLNGQAAADVRGDFDHPDVGGVGERRAECIERASKLGFENQRAEYHRHPHATPITLSSVRRQSAVNAARWIRRKDVHPAQPMHHHFPTGMGASAAHARPSTRRSSRRAVARRGLVVCHHTTAAPSSSDSEPQEIQDLGRRMAVQVAGRLVGENGRPGHQRTRHCHPLHLSARQFRRSVPGPVAEPDPLQ